MMWLSELIEEKQQRQATGPVRRGHLQVFEGGKIAEGVYVRPIGFWRRIRAWLARRVDRPFVVSGKSSSL